MASELSKEKTFKNTWIPDCYNKELTVDMIIAGCRAGVIQFKAMPDEVQTAVSAELQRLKTVDE